MASSTIHIAFCTDTAYIMPCGVAMISVCENNLQESIHFHLVITDDGRLDIEDKIRPLREIVRKYGEGLSVYRMQEENLKEFICTGEKYVSTTAFARIFLPALLPQDIQKVLYLDSDLVVDGSLRPLWDTILSDECPLGACVDSNCFSVRFHKIINVPQSVPYCNSGVLLMNLSYWRKHDLISKAVAVANEKRFPLLDQDLINYMFRDSIQILPIKYNLQSVVLLDGANRCHISEEYYDEVCAAIQSPVIFHYLSANKPWKDALCPKRELWQKYQQMSEWKDLPLEHVVTRFDRTETYFALKDAYWSDADLFIEGQKSFIRFDKAAVLLKNKVLFMRIATSFLDFFSSVLEWTYSYKTRGSRK